MGATALTVGLVSLSIANTISQRESILAKGSVEESIARSNARIAKIQEADAIRRGEKRVSRLRGRQAQLTGTQIANLAGQGIDPFSGTGAAVIVESRFFGDLDILETRNNARLEAFGFRSQALTSEGRGRFARLEAKTAARQTLLTGGLSIARDLAMFGFYKAGQKTTKTGAPKFRPKTPTEARFHKSFRRFGDVASIGFAR